jgi:TolB protein
MAPNDERRNQLFAAPAAGGEPVRLTDESQGVRDAAVAPDGSWIAYSASDEAGGTNLWRLDPVTLEKTRLLACPTALCSKPTLPPAGERALYSRLEFTTDELSMSAPSIWWLDLGTGETGLVFGDKLVPAVTYDWSPDGRWLSYTSGIVPEIRFTDLGSGESFVVPTRTGGHAAWSPSGEAFLLADVHEGGIDTVQKVYRFEAGSAQGRFLIDDLGYDESQPVWSPDGAWIALLRYPNSEGAPAAGDQIWLVRPDGSEARPITSDVDTLHGAPVWSPDGNYLLFSYSLVSEPLPRVRILDVRSGAFHEITAHGTQPMWLP